jgi:hypothetical protein
MPNWANLLSTIVGLPKATWVRLRRVQWVKVGQALMSLAVTLALVSAAGLLVWVIVDGSWRDDGSTTVTTNKTTNSDTLQQASTESPPVAAMATVAATEIPLRAGAAKDMQPATPVANGQALANSTTAAEPTTSTNGNSRTTLKENVQQSDTTTGPDKLSDTVAVSVLGIAALLLVLALFRNRIQSVKTPLVEFALAAAEKESERVAAEANATPAQAAAIKAQAVMETLEAFSKLLGVSEKKK